MASPIHRCKAFFSWNKDENNQQPIVTFLKKVRRHFAKHGIDLTSENHDWVKDKATMSKDMDESLISVVFLTEEYVASPKCMDQLVTLRRNNWRICPILYFDQDFDLYAMEATNVKRCCNRYIDLANKSAKIEESIAHDTFHYVFYTYRWWPRVSKSFLLPSTNQNHFIRRLVKKTLYMMNPIQLDTSRKEVVGLLSSLLPIAAPIVKDSDHLFYIGILGTDPSRNLWIAKWFYNLFYPSVIARKYIAHVPNNDDNLRLWGIHVLYMINYNVFLDKDHVNYFSDLQYFGQNSQDSVIILEVLDNSDQFEKLYQVLTYLGVKTRIIFTTCNQNFFSSSNLSWICNQLSNSETIFSTKLDASEVEKVTEGLMDNSDSVYISHSYMEQIDATESLCLKDYEADEDEESELSTGDNSIESEETNSRVSVVIDPTPRISYDGDSFEDMEQAPKKLKL